MVNYTSLWPNDALLVADLLAGHGARIRLVGGPVRDLMLGLVPKDFDLCTDILPSRMLEVAHLAGIRTIPTLDETIVDPGLWMKGGLKHGTVSFLINGDIIEVTTLRQDLVTDGRRADVAFVNDFRVDAARRDFTINAMSVDLDGQLHDYFGGLEDLRNGVVRFVGNADQRIQEDYLRILRFYRFQSRFGSPDTEFSTVFRETETAIARNVQGMTRLSGERIWGEIGKILASADASRQIRAMQRSGVLAAIGLPGPLNIDQLDAVKRPAEPSSSSVALGLLLGPTGVSTLHDLRTLWKLGRDESELAEFTAMAAERKDADLSTFFDLALQPRANRRHIADFLSVVGRPADADIILGPLPTFPVTGDMLIDRGYSQGKEVGHALAILRSHWQDSAYSATADGLLDLLADHPKPYR